MLLVHMFLEVSLQLGVQTAVRTHESWALAAFVAHVIDQVVTMFVGATALDAAVTERVETVLRLFVGCQIHK